MDQEKNSVPFFDSLLQVANSVRNKEAPRSALKEFLSSLEHSVSQARKEIEEQSAGPELQEELAELEAAFSQFREGCNLLEKYIQDNNEALLEKGLDLVEAAFTEMRKGLLDLGLRKGSLSPSKDQALNLLLNALPSLEKGVCDEGVFEKMLLFYEDHFQKIERNIRRLKRTGEVSPDIGGILGRHVLNQEEARAALLELREAFAQKSFSEMTRSIGILHRFSDEYYGLCQEISVFLSRKEEKNCPRCKQVNPASARVCASCSFVFPDWVIPAVEFDFREGEGPHAGFVMTRNLQKLFDAVEDFQDDQISHGGFTEVLDWMGEKLEKGMQQYLSIGKIPQNFLSANPVLAEEIKKIFIDIVQQYKEGLEEMQEGVSLLRAWADSKKDEDCRKGLSSVVGGASKIQEVLTRAKGVVEKYQAEKEKHGDEYAGSVS